MKFSLILATIGRTTELANFLAHLEAQRPASFELLLVDQNPDGRAARIIEPYRERFPIRYLRSEKGLSRGRNVAIRQAEGEIIAFPDDDCWYPDGLLLKMERLFAGSPQIDGFTGRTVDELGSSEVRFAHQPGYLRKLNAWLRLNSSSIFLRSTVIRTVGDFDETLGPGSGTHWGSADDVDYILRCVEHGFCLYYDPEIVVLHPDQRSAGYERLSERTFLYGAGIGRVWRKHRFPAWYVGYHLARPVGGALLSLAQADRPKARYHWRSFQGRLAGWRSKI